LIITENYFSISVFHPANILVLVINFKLIPFF